jgi:hypothetical protein
LTQSKVVDAAMAEDLGDLLDHIAWTDVLRPAIQTTRVALSSRLTASVLGCAPEGERSSQQLAGMLYGLDLVVTSIEKILRKGASAAESLRANGFSLD